MSPEKQRVAIAEACGWEVTDSRKFVTWKTGIDSYGRNREVKIQSDPLTDLNAMHEAEKVLTKEQQAAYAHTLGRFGNSTDFSLLHTTAAQRAQAFLRTLGKWEESP